MVVMKNLVIGEQPFGTSVYFVILALHPMKIQ